MFKRLLGSALLLGFAPALLAGQTYYSERAAPPFMARYGGALAVGDGEVFVGESANTYRSGFVYVYRRGAGGWAEAIRLTAPGAALGDGFGASLAADGPTLLIGSTDDNDGRGAVHVYSKGANGAWTHSSTLSAADAQSGDAFGTSVALTGEWAFVGAAEQNDGVGSVYGFRRGANGAYTQVGKFDVAAAQAAAGRGGRGRRGGGQPEEPEPIRFGTSLVAADGALLVGAPGAVSGGGRGRRGGGGGGQPAPPGLVFAFEQSGDTWQATNPLTVQYLRSGDQFGATIALDGDRALVGAPGHGDSGGVFAFALEPAPQGRGGGQAQPQRMVWAFQEEIRPGDGDEQARFGSAVALNGDEAWFGAPNEGDEGAVVIYDQQGDSYARGETLTSDAGSQFGATVATRGDVAAVGVLGALNNGGSVVIFERSGGVWREAHTLMSEPDELPVVTGSDPIRCGSGGTEGMIDVYECGNVELISFLPITHLSADGHRGARMNDVWGWMDPETGKEYAIVGRTDGTAFVDISDASNPVLLGDLPKTPGVPSGSWRDIKTYQNHAFIVADGSGAHGMQVFDLTRLRDVQDAPVFFEPDVLYTGINSSHDIVINEESGYAYAVGLSAGGETCGGGSHIIDIRDPKNPTFAGCFAHEGTGRSGTGYTHDAQCVMYHGPDERYTGREICVAANENALSIADLTDKQNPTPLSTAEYPYYGYTHQGWFTEDQRYFFQDDESDETGPDGDVPFTRTMIWDLTNLEDPVLAKEFYGKERTYDHNLYIKGNLVYQSNYKSGLRVLDISDPLNPVEIAYFDNYPIGENNTGFSGSWSNYPFFESGTIVVTGIGEGVYFVKVGPTTVF